MSEQKRTKEKKKAVIEALKKTMGVISPACDMVGIGRTIFYQWMKEDPEFAEAVNNMPEYALDFVESKLYEQISKGDTTAIIFNLKTKGKKRGYIEKTQHEHSGGIGLPTLKVEIVKPDESK